ncbi:MAG: AAA family ATPase [Firmicutes bacterium]|nr:AAA family ATPase [Bacillota bacterium]
MQEIIKWQQELSSFKGVKSTFIIEGNINDKYYFQSPQGAYFDNLEKTLSHILDGDLIFYDPLFGFYNPDGQGNVGELVQIYQDLAKSQRERIRATIGTTEQNSETIRAAITMSNPNDKDTAVSVIVNLASRLISAPNNLAEREITMFLNFFYASKNAVRVGKNIKNLILVVDKINDIPAWFYLNNPNIRTVAIPNPDRAARKAFVESRFRDLQSQDEPTVQIRNKFIDLTEGMKLLEIDELRRLYNNAKMPVEEISDTISIYKFGFKENKWQAMREQLANTDISEEIRKRVKGQPQAVAKISQIIKRSVTGLSGMQHSAGGSKPRGILFLAGPTGTGKTEIVKTVTAMLFGDEKSLIRFDMSEYSAENADQKLFGAPPGYVGYDNGGQLTNAIKSNPFAVLLFDEIEKAHTSIMDKFLQILEDGRMTDGQGNTVYFSETLIFFTSNAGISAETYDFHGNITERRAIVNPGDSYETIENSVKSALKTKFKPEVLNRIGNNVIVFDYITEATTAEILALQIDNIVKRIAKDSKIFVDVKVDVLEKLTAKCLQQEVRENGGRGIGNVVESEFINPLSVYIFDTAAHDGDTITVFAEDSEIKFAVSKL